MKEMEDDKLKESIRQIQCPYEIDVIEGVMSEIYLQQKKVGLWQSWGRNVAAVAAVLVLGIGVWLFAGNDANLSDMQFGYTSASLYDVDEYSSSASYIEEMDYFGLYNEE